MKIYIDDQLSKLNDLMIGNTVINIEDLSNYTLDELLKIESLVVVASGEKVQQLVEQLINSRPSESNLISNIQKHPNLVVLLDTQGAQQIL